jgi:hypothetical protein
MRSFAQNCSAHEHDRIVYEGSILYDYGHREEALAKAKQSLLLQRSFDDFLLKAYVSSGNSSLIIESVLSVVQC